MHLSLCTGLQYINKDEVHYAYRVSFIGAATAGNMSFTALLAGVEEADAADALVAAAAAGPSGAARATSTLRREPPSVCGLVLLVTCSGFCIFLRLGLSDCF